MARSNMRIGELAKRTGVNSRLLRYYEEQGLLQPRRTSAGYRTYSDDDVTRVRHIRMLLGAGLSTPTIAHLLPCMGERDGELVPLCPELLPEFEAELARVQATIAELESARGLLTRIIAEPLPAGVYSA